MLVIKAISASFLGFLQSSRWRLRVSRVGCAHHGVWAFSQAVDEMSDRFVDAVKEDLKLVGVKEEDVEDKG